MVIEPVIGRAAVELELAPTMRGRLAALAVRRPLVIDYYASRFRGVATGDLIVWFGEPASERCYIELESIDAVTVLAERHLVGLLEGATLREAGPPWASPPHNFARPPGSMDRRARSTSLSEAVRCRSESRTLPGETGGRA
jgi:hypothetical protein